MTSKREIRRAVRDASDELERALPDDLQYALHEAWSYADAQILLAGTLAGIGIELARAYEISGALVRDAILYLHGALNAEMREPIAGSEPPRGFEALAARVAGLRLFVEATGADPSEVRRAVFGWIEVASQRLTMERYPRADERARHARSLIAAPAKAAGLPVSEADAEWFLRLWDVMGEEEAARKGRNLVSNPTGERLGGFYAIAEAGVAATAEEVNATLRALREEAKAIERRLEPERSAAAEVFGVLADRIGERIETGKWPVDLARGPIKGVRPPSLWRRVFG